MLLKQVSQLSPGIRSFTIERQGLTDDYIVNAVFRGGSSVPPVGYKVNFRRTTAQTSSCPTVLATSEFYMPLADLPTYENVLAPELTADGSCRRYDMRLVTEAEDAVVDTASAFADAL